MAESSLTPDVHPVLAGHAAVLRRLATGLRSDRSAHAQVFSGPRGIGKAAVALEYARLLLCDQDGTSPCGSCPQCAAALRLQHPDLHMVFPLPPGVLKKKKSGDDSDELDETKIADAVAERTQALSADPFSPTYITLSSRRDESGVSRIRLSNHTIRLPQIRGLLRKVARKSFQARRKVYLIFHAETMNVQAQNALLKALEEPPPDGYFLLVAENERDLLPTIRSRCQSVRLGRLDAGTLTAALVNDGSDRRQAEIAARLSNGSYLRARDLVERDLIELQTDVIDFLAESARCNPLEMPETTARAQEQLEATDRSYFDFLGLFLRDAALCDTSDTAAEHIIFSDLRDRIIKLTRAYPQADFQQAIAAVDKSAGYISAGYTPELVLTALMIRIHRALGPRLAKSKPAR